MSEVPSPPPDLDPILVRRSHIHPSLPFRPCHRFVVGSCFSDHHYPTTFTVHGFTALGSRIPSHPPFSVESIHVLLMQPLSSPQSHMGHQNVMWHRRPSRAKTRVCSRALLKDRSGNPTIGILSSVPFQLINYSPRLLSLDTYMYTHTYTH